MRTKRASQKGQTAQRTALHTLVQKQGLPAGEYALFFVTGQGTFLPTGARGDRVEESSGYVLDKHGRVFSFWLGWDAVKQEAAMTEWREVQTEPHWADTIEYCTARRRVGLQP